MKSQSTPPTVTIGMPVYNEEKFVALSIESLLSQSFRDFRLVISDNASTDRTTEICQTYAQQDSRIKVILQDENLGAVTNFRSVLENVNSPYFMWAGSHDLWAPSYLQELTQSLNRQPDVGLAYANTRVIDGDGCTTIECTPDRVSFLDESPLKRAHEIVRSLTWCNLVYGLFRTNVISQCRLDVPCLGNDHVFLMEAALRGKIIHVPRTSFVRREYRPPSNDHRAQLQRILGKKDVSKQLERRYTNWFYEHVKSAFRVPARLDIRIYRTFCLGLTFLERWEPQFESRAILVPYQLIRRCDRRMRKIRRRLTRMGERITALFAKTA